MCSPASQDADHAYKYKPAQKPMVWGIGLRQEPKSVNTQIFPLLDAEPAKS